MNGAHQVKHECVRFKFAKGEDVISDENLK